MIISNSNFLLPSKALKKENNQRTNIFFNSHNLKTDVVSFSARAKLLAENMSYAPTYRDCNHVNINAIPSSYYLKKVLDKYISQYVNNGIYLNRQEDDKPILRYSVRRKSANSIREKVVSKYSKIFADDLESFCSLAVDEILLNFKSSKKISKKTIINNLVQTLGKSQVKMPPFENIPYFLSQIFSTLDSYKIIDLTKYSAKDIKGTLSRIEDKLSQYSNSENLDDDGCYIKPHTISGIKHYANDIVGARIIMTDSGDKDIELIFDALTSAVKDGYIKITSVENNAPDPDKLPEGKNIDDYVYAKDYQLRAFARNTNSKLIQNKSKSGYLAIHINIEFTNPVLALYNGEYKGFSGEIQIIGRDVERLKEIEDLCYKLKDNKNAIDIMYKPFKEHFQKYYSGDKVKQAFDDYTYALYLALREIKTVGYRGVNFPSIEELGFKGKVPPELDFNYLKELKDMCELNSIRSYVSEKCASDKTTVKPTEALKQLKKDNDINSIQKLINNQF